MSVSLNDIVVPLSVGDGHAVWLKAPMYCSGGQLVMTKDQVAALGMSILDVPQPDGSVVPVATVDIKDTDGMVFRNRQYSDTAMNEQLPLMSTRQGRVLVNAPSVLKDPAVGPYQFRVYGAMKADSLEVDDLVVSNVHMLNMEYIKDIDVLPDRSILVTRQNDTQFVLPLTWDMITDKPPIELTLDYLQGRMQVAQFNVDFLLNEVGKLRDDVDSLKRAKDLQDADNAQQSEDFSQIILQHIADTVADVSVL